MSDKAILIFNENMEERSRLAELLKAEDLNVFETSRALEALHILKANDINIVLASQSLTGIETEEFKALVENIRPGVNVMFIGSLSDSNGTVSLAKAGFKQYFINALKSEKTLNKRVGEFKDFMFSFTDRLLQLFDVKDKYFFNNDQLVAKISRMIAARMGLDEDMLDAIQMAALLKDIGKVGIQQKLLEEKKRFDSSDMVSIKTHPLNAVQILRDIKFPWNIDSIISQHHESYDGSGYPAGLKGRQICIGARIVHIADSYVAMKTDRPYRQALSHEEACEDIRKKAGTEFDPEAVEIFLDIIKENPPLMDDKKNILLLERQPSLSAMIRLSVDPNHAEVKHASNSLDAVRAARLRPPDLIIADVDMLDQKTFIHFYNTIQEIPSIKDKPFIFVLPDADYPRQFKGARLTYLVKPVDMGQMITAINSMLQEEIQVEPSKTEPTKGLSGTLEDFSVTDIIQILNLGLKTAKVELKSDGHEGTIFMDYGKVIHASTPDMSGKDAFMEMSNWTSGTFQIMHGMKTSQANINMETVHLLLETARIYDEKRRHMFN